MTAPGEHIPGFEPSIVHRIAGNTDLASGLRPNLNQANDIELQAYLKSIGMEGTAGVQGPRDYAIGGGLLLNTCAEDRTAHEGRYMDGYTL